MTYEEGCDEFIIDANNIHKLSDSDSQDSSTYNILEIDYSGSVSGQVFEIIFPKNLEIENAYISFENESFTNPIIE